MRRSYIENVVAVGFTLFEFRAQEVRRPNVRGNNARSGFSVNRLRGGLLDFPANRSASRLCFPGNRSRHW